MTTTPAPASPTRQSGQVLTGVPVVPGVAFAPVIRPGRHPELDTLAAAPEVAEAGREAEAARFRAAVSTVAERLRDRASQSSGSAAEVLAATAKLAEDRAWLGEAETRMKSGVPATRAAAESVAKFADLFTKMGGLMAERVTDLQDIRDRVIAELSGLPEPGVPVPDEPSILCAEDLAPADTAGLDPALIVGLATTLGGPTSHTAIIARQLAIPCVVAVAGLDDVETGTKVLIDGSQGTVAVSPDAAAAGAAVDRAREAAAALGGWSGPGATSDGHVVGILANVQDGAAARTAAKTPVEGVGLFRTELCFLNTEAEPTVEEQAAIYAQVLEAFAGKKVVIRTLDAGSDKPLKFANSPDEPNPALGVRGIRTSFHNQGLIDHQLEGIAVAAERTGNKPWVMAPMIATADEAKNFAGKVRALGLSPGVMIEVPAAALLADKLLEHVDFLSIGTNDLAQYTMAADRMSAELATLTDPWQPGVLKLIGMTGTAGAAVNKPVGVCGEAAADPLLACVLVGLGISSLSGASAAITAVGAKVASVSLQQCRDAAAAVLTTASATEARAAASAVLG